MYKRDARRALFPRGELLVHLHERGDAVGLGHLEREAVGAHDGAVVGAVSLAQFLRHEDFVVEVGEAAVRVELPRFCRSIAFRSLLFACFVLIVAQREGAAQGERKTCDIACLPWYNDVSISS